MTPSSPSFAFAPGWHLYLGPQGTWRLASPDGAFVRVSGAEHALEACAQGRRCEGDDALVAGLAARGALTGEHRTSVRPRPVVHVEGGDPVARAAVVLLAGQAKVVTGTVDEDVVVACDAVVCISGHLPDSRWRQVDEWCRRHDTALTTCTTEGESVVLGPAGRPGRSASYEDARGRRLAAAPLPEELAALWAHLENGAPATEVRWPAAPACSALAGFLVHDLLEVLAGRPVGRQLVVDPRSMTLTSHPVLPLPSGIPALAL